MTEQSNAAIDILISGAGACGLTLALELARRGVAFRLIDKAEAPFIGSRGKGIQPRTQEIFEDLEILDRLLSVSGLYPPQRDYREDGSHVDTEIVENRKATAAEPYHIALMAPQFLTERVMRERLAELGSAPEYGMELTGFEQDAEGVTARVASNGEEKRIRARYLVGADGGRSFVRGALGIDFPGSTLGVRAIVADVMVSGLGRDAWHRFADGDMTRQCSLCPLAGTDLFQLQAPIPMEGEVDLSAEGLTRFVAERSGDRDIVIQSVRWASAFQMNARLAETYRAGRVFLAGDAAHIHPPTGGQGLNTSVQDAYNLGWKLAAVCGGAGENLLDSYEEERRPIAEGMLGLSTRLLDAAKAGDMWRGREVHQLDIGYAGSSLTLEQPPREGRGLIAGDRAPDAPIHGCAGQPSRIFNLLRGSHWTLIGQDVGRSAIAPRPGLRVHAFGHKGDLRDEAGHFRQAYQLEAGEWVLIRPDGYIGAFVKDAARTDLERYLARVL